MLRRNATGAVLRLSGSSGPALGPILGAAYTEGVEHLEPGDIVVLYTDGLAERRGRDFDTGLTEVERIVAGWGPDSSLSRGPASLYRAMAPRPRVDHVCPIVVRVPR